MSRLDPLIAAAFIVLAFVALTNDADPALTMGFVVSALVIARTRRER